MRQRIFHIGLLVVMLVVGAGAFTITHKLGPEQSGTLGCTRQWLGLSQNQCDRIRSEDPGFSEQARELSRALQTQREVLAGLISDPDSDADAIRAVARKVLDAHHDLMRRVVQHLLVVRRHTNPRQCMRLTGLCSGVICSGGGRGSQGNQRQGQGMGTGRRGMGMGIGQGPRRRHGRLGPALGLTDEQRKAGAEKDASFEADSVQLAQQIHDAHGQLAQALEDSSAAEGDVQQALEKLIALRVQLEQRTVDYVLSIRPLLDTEQQQCLISLSGGGRRRRSGPGWGF